MAIDRDEVVRTAVRILDEYGLADLSMRRLADALGVKAGALYWHVANKQTLLAAVADEVLGEVPPPRDGSRDALVDWAVGLRRVLLAHRDSAELVATALASGLCATDPLAPVVAVLDASAPGARTEWSARALLHLVLGQVSHEQDVRLFRELGLLAPGEEGPGDEEFRFAVTALVRGLQGGVVDAGA